MSNELNLVTTESDKIKIEFSADEEIMALIKDNTHRMSKISANNVYKCIALIAGGTAMQTACRLTGIPRVTLQRWRSKEWYSRVIELIRIQLDEQLDGKLTHILNKGISKLHDRLDVGDAVVKRDGTIIYKPVSAKDAAIISSIFFDKRNLLRNKPTSITSSQSTDERLDKLAARFRDIATVDGEYVEVNDNETSETQDKIESDGATTDQGKESQECFTFKSTPNAS